MDNNELRVRKAVASLVEVGIMPVGVMVVDKKDTLPILLSDKEEVMDVDDIERGLLLTLKSLKSDIKEVVEYSKKIDSKSKLKKISKIKLKMQNLADLTEYLDREINGLKGYSVHDLIDAAVIFGHVLAEHAVIKRHKSGIDNVNTAREIQNQIVKFIQIVSDINLTEPPNCPSKTE